MTGSTKFKVPDQLSNKERLLELVVALKEAEVVFREVAFREVAEEAQEDTITSDCRISCIDAEN